MIYTYVLLAVLVCMTGWIIRGQQIIMSKITDFAAKVQSNDAALNVKLDSIVAGVASLEALITTLEHTVTGLTQEEQAALDAVSSESDALVVKANAIDTTAPAPPQA